MVTPMNKLPENKKLAAGYILLRNVHPPIQTCHTLQLQLPHIHSALLPPSTLTPPPTSFPLPRPPPFPFLLVDRVMSTSDVLERLEDIVPFVGGRALKKQQYEIYARVPKAETTACSIRILHQPSNRSEIFHSRPKEGKYSKEHEKENFRIMGILSRLPHQQQVNRHAYIG